MKKVIAKMGYAIIVSLSALIITSCSPKEPSKPVYGPLPSETGEILIGSTVKFTSTNKDIKGETYEWQSKGESISEAYHSVGSGKVLEYKFAKEGITSIRFSIATKSGTRYDYHDYKVVTSTSSNTTSSVCFIGVWTMTPAGYPKASTETINSDHTATLSDWTSDGSMNRIVTWTWAESNGYIDWHYTSYKVNGTDVYTQSTMPKDEHTAYTCSGNTFSSGGVTWHK